ncbi:MAG: hypothetical protein HZT40_12105 [Candidatus Thiothrix singaporensis]|uniref:DUF202 domain-containing protein n=1 Tax=Candidatus Thiothrix singaporensis TaxID=2799669 RepID=A0A7L6ASZ6_9GAMM|nr:MAG: hypothetical protein HZT40_12105 [Candidatus Thiothrix singaporensis]
MQQPDSNAIAINAVQLLLAEKRTSLSVLRTGIAILALPLSLMSFLIATSKYYDVFHTLHLVIPLGAFCLALLVLGAYLVTHSLLKMHKHDRLIRQIKAEHEMIGKYID